MRGYQILLPLRMGDPFEDLVTLAGHLLPEGGGTIELMGIVVVPSGCSLSEAAIPARECREALMRVVDRFPELPLHVKPRVRVGHIPWQEVVAELQTQPVDLLLIPWERTETTVLGAPLEEVITRAPCDLILARGIVHRYDRVLVPIRGGPHIELTLRLSRALAEITGEAVTLLTVSEEETSARELEHLRESTPFEVQVLSASGDPLEAIQQLVPGYHALVLGTTVPQPDQRPTLGDVPAQLLEQSALPIFLVQAFRRRGPEIPQEYASVVTISAASDLSDRVDRWFATNTFHWSEFEDLEQLVRWKEERGQTISLVLPALNEEATVGNVIRTIKTALMDDCPLLDEIILMDSNSTDRTREIAASLGIPVYVHQEVLADEVGTYAGKGEALWKSLYVTRGDIIAWIDTDIVNIHPRFVIGILGPLLRWDRIQYVKGFYRRPLRVGDKIQAGGGGRVTELVARPFINLFFPELSGVVQPLSGEYAGRRQALERLPFFTGYGVETGLLVDLLQQFGLSAIAQCDLEVRIHHNQPLASLSKMAFAILQVFFSRLEARDKVRLLEGINRTMKIIRYEPWRFYLEEEEITEHERPPIITIPAYRAKFGRED